jgi:hypothetical protein
MSKGRAMRWFRKDPRPEVWEAAGQQPVGDIDAAHIIREICAFVEASSERIAASGPRARKKDMAFEAERQQAAITRALEIAMRISDDPMRDVSVSQIIHLCVKANHLKTARILLRAIRSKQTQAELIADHPALALREAS